VIMTKEGTHRERANLKEARRKAKLSQLELAEEIRVSRETISLWERGVADPQPAYVRALCEFLGVDDRDELLAIEESEQDTENSQNVQIVSHQERTKLKAARVERGLTQAQLANEIKCGQRSIASWEMSESDPQDHWINELCTFFDKEPHELDLAKELTESELAMLQEILKNKRVDRRQALAIVSSIPAFAGVDLSVLESSGIVVPERFLSQCNAVINVCWQFLDYGGYAAIKGVLAEYIPTLLNLASQPSKYRESAASLMVQIKIMASLLATRDHNFVERKILCLEAVQFGELSGDSLAHTAALYWQADTHVYCYRQPQKAIPLLEKGLTCLDSDSSQNKSALYSNLAIAYGQEGDESKARNYAEQARNAMSKYIKTDPFRCILGSSALYRDEGRLFLALAKRFPDGSFAQRAYDTFSQSLGNNPTSERSLSQILIHKADAAIGIDDLHEYIRCLTEGARIAFRLDSKNRKQEAFTVLHKAPESWQKEKEYQELVKMF
jgi:transcriptional regulator with XRE-family HTH domain